MKRVLSFIAFLVLTNLTYSQNDYKSLQILYADGNYEKLVKKAEGYTNKEDTKKDPEAYLWLAKGLYKIHVSGNQDPIFKNAYKDAINAMKKCIRYDESGVLSDPDNKEFLDELQNTLVEQITNEFYTKDYRKAYSWAVKYKKISTNLIGEKFVSGACKFLINDKYTAFPMWREAADSLANVTSLDSWSKADIEMLKIGIIQTAECYVSIRKVDDAQEILNKVAQWFEDDQAFKEVYDKIVN